MKRKVKIIILLILLIISIFLVVLAFKYGLDINNILKMYEQNKESISAASISFGFAKHMYLVSLSSDVIIIGLVYLFKNLRKKIKKVMYLFSLITMPIIVTFICLLEFTNISFVRNEIVAGISCMTLGALFALIILIIFDRKNKDN